MVNSVTIGSLTIDGNPYTISQMSGLGSANVETTAFPRPDVRGLSFIRSTYRDRRVSIQGTITGTTVSNYLSNRRSFFGALNNTDGLFTVKFTLQDGLALQFDAVVENPIEAPYLPGYVTSGDYMIELKAPDPAFYAQAASSGEVGLASGETLTSAGNLASYPEFYVYGPGTNFTIVNTSATTGESKTMQLLGTLASGEWYYVDVRDKQIFRNTAINDFEVHAGQWWNIEPGNNNITFAVASGSTDDTRFVAIWRDAYIGI